MFKHYINRRYCEENAEGTEGSSGGEPAAPIPEVPADGVLDTIPEETSLWDTLSQDSDESEDLEPEEGEPTPAEVPPEEPKPEPVVESPVEPEPKPEPVPEPVVETPPEEPLQAPEPTVPPPTEAEVAQQREEIQTQLEKRFSITEDEALQLVTDPQQLYPKLQARMFTEMWNQLTTMVRENLPEAIEYNVRNMETRDGKVDGFFTAWPKLNRAEHGETIANVAKVYSQVKPKATEAEITRQVGMQVMMLHNITPDVVADQNAPAETPLAPHQPAAVNGGTRLPVTDQNIWATLSEDLDDD